MKQHHLSKLRAGKLKAITSKTYRRILAALPSHQHERFRQAFEVAGGKGRKAAYADWLRRSERRLFLSIGRRHIRTEGGVELERAVSGRGRAGEREGEFVALWAIADNRTNGALTAFRRRQVARDHDEDRVDLSLWRIMAPLLEAANTGFVERHWRELSTSEFVAFIKAGIRREEIVLNRPGDAQRIQEVARLDPREFLRRFGPENTRHLVERRSIVRARTIGQ